MNVLKAPTTDPAATAGAIAKDIRIDGGAEMQVVGRAANQAVKVTTARSSLAASGMDVRCIPGFATVRINGDETETERTGIPIPRLPRHDLSARRRRATWPSEAGAQGLLVP
jgi:stage V sporulation protein S